mmetsp:Transcript_13304/g.23651  ORF Transcript_13304/g.23651 Transcript_13304/m.23651 type:complete len:344 (-) Transcript_13304:201-1232(-)
MGFAERLGTEGQVVFSACGIYFFYLYYGVLQERIFRPDPETGERFAQTLFLLTVQCLFNFSLGAVAVAVAGGAPSKKPISETAKSSPLPVNHSGTVWLALISLSYMTAMGCSNESLQYVSYPFQALAKSCKMVPVMLGNVIIGGKRYSLIEYAVVAMITGGVVLFQMSKTSGSFTEGSTGWGFALLMGSLALDGFTSSNQKLFSDEFKPSGHLMMRQMNLWSLLFLFPLLAVTGEGIKGFEYVMTHPETLYDVVMFGLCSAIGQQFIFFCVVGPGPLVCTTITTTRKFFTVLLSVLWFPDNHLVFKQWVAVGLVFCGLSIELVNGIRKKRAAAASAVEAKKEK